MQNKMMVLSPLLKGGNRGFCQGARLTEKSTQFNEKIYTKKYSKRRRQNTGDISQ
jgi:hypothetical protein